MPVTHVEILLLANSLLLALSGIFLGVIGYFLKDLHAKFSSLVDRVNELTTDHSKETTGTRVHRQHQDRAITHLTERIERIELHLLN